MDTVFFDIGHNGKSIGRVSFKLYRDVFPDGVENFYRIAEGKTWRSEQMLGYVKQSSRTYSGTKFYRMAHNKHLIGGDIYSNDGTDAGTIFDDEAIPEIVADYYIPHDQPYLLSLISYPSESRGKLYDSTFMITLAADLDLDASQTVIGSLHRGGDILDRINASLVPSAGRRYPTYSILESGVEGGLRVTKPFVPRLAYARQLCPDAKPVFSYEYIDERQIRMPKRLD